MNGMLPLATRQITKKLRSKGFGPFSEICKVPNSRAKILNPPLIFGRNLSKERSTQEKLRAQDNNRQSNQRTEYKYEE